MNRRFKAGDIIQFNEGRGYISMYIVLGYGPDYLWTLDYFDGKIVGKIPSYFLKDECKGLSLVKPSVVKSNKPAWF